MESGLLPDAAITASSFYSSGREAFRGRLNNVPVDPIEIDGGSWASGTNSAGQWLQVDLGEVKVLTKVATQGRPNYDQWVTSYKIALSKDAIQWKTFKEKEIDKVSLTVVLNAVNLPWLGFEFAVQNV